MLEKDIEESINYSSNNYAKDKVQSSNKDIKLESDSNFIIVILFLNKKNFSIEVPKIWNTKKLLYFIMYIFKSEFNNSKPVFILKGEPLSPQSETPLKDILNSSKINYLTISLKSNNQENQNNADINNLNLKTNKEVFNSDEFIEMERKAIDDYIKIFRKNSVNTFPLMNPAYNHRREQININSELEKLAAFEPVPLEDFPRGKYFQLKIIFKCFISFFAFGIYIKGFNFILFLWVLIGYYWYCVNNVIDEFYNKKIQEIGISEEEYKRIKNEGINEYKGLGQGKELFIINDDNEDNEAGSKKNDEQKKIEDKKDNNISDNNINKTINELKNDIEEDLKGKEEDKKEINNINSFVLSKEDDKNKEDREKEKENDNNINEETPLLNNINDILTGNNLRDRNNNNRINNANIFTENNRNNNINNLNNDIFGQSNNSDNRDDKNENENQDINRPESAIEIIYQIISVFFLSLIPVWCDEFEINNPISVNNNHQDDENNNENNDNNNINNDNDNNNIINNDNNINNINNDFNNEINDNNYRPTSVEENDSNNNKMTSSRVVNMSDDSSRDTRIYKLIKKENQSANENEYVFSENGGIDNLSMNSELYKQKKEKEKEKDKEKEKQIFEEDEEYIIEEDKKNK